MLNGPGKTKAKRTDRVQSTKRAGAHKTNTPNSPKESLVCLTQDQLQQLLSNINKSTCPEEKEDAHSKVQTGKFYLSTTYQIDITQMNNYNRVL